jgi:hypothetical protein
VRYADDGAPVPTELAAHVPSVADLFALVGDALARGAALTLARYDGVTGVPTQIYIDWDARMVDDEILYVASDLRWLRLADEPPG